MEDSGRGAEAGESPWASAEVPSPKPAAAAADGDDASDAPQQQQQQPPPHKALDDLTNKEGGAAAGGGGRKSGGKTATEAGSRSAETGVEGEEKKEGEDEDDTGGGRRDPTAGFEFTCGVLSVDEADGGGSSTCHSFIRSTLYRRSTDEVYIQHVDLRGRTLVARGAFETVST